MNANAHNTDASLIHQGPTEHLCTLHSSLNKAKMENKIIQQSSDGICSFVSDEVENTKK